MKFHITVDSKCVLKLLNGLKIYKAPWPDGLGTLMLKHRVLLLLQFLAVSTMSLALETVSKASMATELHLKGFAYLHLMQKLKAFYGSATFTCISIYMYIVSAENTLVDAYMTSEVRVEAGSVLL